MMQTRYVKFGRKVAWYEGNVPYLSCETPLKAKKVTSFGKTQSELTAQTDCRLRIIAYSQKYEGDKSWLFPQGGLGTFPCWLLNLFTACAGAVRAAKRQQGP